MMRKLVTTVALAIALTACSGADGKITVNEILGKIQQACGFKTTADQIIRVIATVVTGFDAGAGAMATVAAGIGDQIATRVCTAVQASSSPAVTRLMDSSGVPITVVVNGVPIEGTLEKKEEKK